MNMPCRNPCYSFHGQRIYTFVNNKTTRFDAMQECWNSGKVLAHGMSTNDYMSLNSCCNSPASYRIGLTSAKYCYDNLTSPYFWITGINKDCVDGSPLTIERPSKSRCWTTVITVGGVNDVLNATWRDCRDALPYICQETSKPVIFQPSDINFTPAYEWALMGGALGFLIAMLLMIKLYCVTKRYFVISCNRKKRHSSTASKPGPTPNAGVYEMYVFTMISQQK